MTEHETPREGLAAEHRLAEVIHASEHADNPIVRLRSVSDPRLTVAACFACLRTADVALAWLTEQLADEGLREAVARAVESDWESADYWAPADAALGVVRAWAGGAE